MILENARVSSLIKEVLTTSISVRSEATLTLSGSYGIKSIYITSAFLISSDSVSIISPSFSINLVSIIVSNSLTPVHKSRHLKVKRVYDTEIDYLSMEM